MTIKKASKDSVFENSKITVAVIDDSPQRSQALEELLHSVGYTRTFVIDIKLDVVDQILQLKPDVVLVEIESPRRDMLEQLSTLRDRRPTPVAVFCQNGQAQSIHAAVESGVCAYVVEGVQPDQVKPAIGLAMSTFRAFNKLRQQADAAKQQLHDRKRIDHAKRILMAKQNLSEEEAFQAIKKLAMDRQRKLPDAADDIVAFLKAFS